MKRLLKLTSLTPLNVFTFGFFITMATAMFLSANISALSAQDFKDGRIIDDAVFYDKDSMSVSQVQDFLNRIIPNCDTWGTSQSEYGGGTRAQYAASVGWPAPPYTCLNNYHENPTTHETSYEKGGGAFSGGISAAQIIYNAAQQYDISPKVLLVLLKKESAGPLTADAWPLKSQYKYAMGYACPDSGPSYSANCDSEKSGFYNQMMLAAWQLKYYLEHPNDYRYGIGTNQIQYSPDPNCGTKTVNIENIATLSLYIYTPYVPNDSALANYPGIAPCGAYGNRNFFMFFNEWFGSTYGSNFIPLSNPRWMQIKTNDVKKVYVYTGQSVGDPLSASQQVRFVDKILINGKWYLRTEYNHNDGGQYGIAMENVEEIAYQPISPMWLTLGVDGNRSHPASRTAIGDVLVKGTSVKVVDRILINGNIYYRTEFNSINGQDVGIHSRFTTSFNPVPLDGPRVFCSDTKVNKMNPQSGQIISSSNSGGQYMITKKTQINSVWYYQDQKDEGTLNFIDSSAFKNTCYTPFDSPRDMILKEDAPRINPFTKEVYDTLQKDKVLSLATKILINNEWYYRTAFNTQNNTDAVISAASFREL